LAYPRSLTMVFRQLRNRPALLVGARQSTALRYRRGRPKHSSDVSTQHAQSSDMAARPAAGSAPAAEWRRLAPALLTAASAAAARAWLGYTPPELQAAADAALARLRAGTVEPATAARMRLGRSQLESSPVEGTSKRMAGGEACCDSSAAQVWLHSMCPTTEENVWLGLGYGPLWHIKVCPCAAVPPGLSAGAERTAAEAAQGCAPPPPERGAAAARARVPPGGQAPGGGARTAALDALQSARPADGGGEVREGGPRGPAAAARAHGWGGGWAPSFRAPWRRRSSRDSAARMRGGADAAPGSAGGDERQWDALDEKVRGRRSTRVA